MHLVKPVRLVALAAVVLTASLAASASSQVPPGGYPRAMPATPMPSIKGCSSSQQAYLRQAWRLAHFTTWRAKRLLDHIESQPRESRAELWNRDHVTGDDRSPSPRRWFGPYDRGNASFVRRAVDKAEKRFRRVGKHVEGVKTLRCGQPGTRNDAHVDVCPAGNPGGNGAPTAYHFPIGTVVTCPSFWNQVNNNFVEPETRLRNAASILVHEIFHHLSVDRKYVVDYHGDGVGGHPDKKYYGIDNVNYLADRKRSWAIRNNDTYRFFSRGVGNAEPAFSGSWAAKDAGGTGGLFFDLTWNGLVAKWQELGAQGQYLADVETYVRDGSRRYAALWRIGPGNGALHSAPWSAFESHWRSVKGTQDLIDVEVYRTGGSWRYLGVYRRKQGAVGDGGLFTGLTWNGLVDRWRQFGAGAYLADVETYVDRGQRRYTAVWRAGAGNGSLLQSSSWSAFAEYKQSRNGTEQLIDFEEWIEGGRRKFLGVWRAAPAYGPLNRGLLRDAFVASWTARWPSSTLIDLEEESALPLRVP